MTNRRINAWVMGYCVGCSIRNWRTLFIAWDECKLTVMECRKCGTTVAWQ